MKSLRKLADYAYHLTPRTSVQIVVWEDIVKIENNWSYEANIFINSRLVFTNRSWKSFISDEYSWIIDRRDLNNIANAVLWSSDLFDALLNNIKNKAKQDAEKIKDLESKLADFESRKEYREDLLDNNK